jgi:hypothetical protein
MTSPGHHHRLRGQPGQPDGDYDHDLGDGGPGPPGCSGPVAISGAVDRSWPSRWPRRAARAGLVNVDAIDPAEDIAQRSNRRHPGIDQGRRDQVRRSGYLLVGSIRQRHLGAKSGGDFVRR